MKCGEDKTDSNFTVNKYENHRINQVTETDITKFWWHMYLWWEAIGECPLECIFP